VSPDLRRNVLEFYHESAQDTERQQGLRWRRTKRELQKLQTAQVE
jgi:hypothetical protein